MTAPAALLGRMRANAAEALAQGASLAEVQAHLLAVTRGISRPGQTEADDGAELAEHAETLNGFRAMPPGAIGRSS